MSKQLSHYEFKEKQIQFKSNISIILENFEHEENIGSAFRLADAFNIDQIIIVSNNDNDMKKVEKTARSCQKTVSYQMVDNIEQAIDIVKKDHYIPVAVEICSDSKPLRDVDFSKTNGVAFIMGNERHGVSQKALDLSKGAVHIDMYGNNSSMNVSTALAITLYKASEDLYKKKLMEVDDGREIS